MGDNSKRLAIFVHQTVSMTQFVPMKTGFTLLIGLLLLPWWLFAAGGYSIKVSIEGYSEKKITLAYYFGNQKYVKDTASRGADGLFVFKGATPLQAGIYSIVLEPEKIGLDILVSEKEQQFSIQTKKIDPFQNLRFTGSLENDLFQKYIRFVSEQNPISDTLRAQYKRSPEGPQKEKFKNLLQQADSTQLLYVQNFIRQNKGTYAALVIKAALPIRYPSFTGTSDEKMIKTWLYARKHCFDNIPIQDFRLLRTPHYFQAITTYVDDLLFQHPDSLNAGIDYILNQLRLNKEAFEYYAVHFLRQYLQPKVMGMDAVFVHMVEQYLQTGQVKLSSADQQAKIVQMVQKLKPLLIGKVSPNIPLIDRQGKKFNLHDLDAEYTLLIIWAYDCGHCKHSAPFWKSFYDQYKDKGVKLVALCYVPESEIPACWKYVDDNGFGAWLHAYDPLLRFAKPYNVETTPQVYLMDRNKVIIGKQIVAEQMEDVVGKIIELQKKGKI